MIFGCTGLVLIILMTFINVVCRYSFGFIITPFEEISLILFVWCCYIGASISFRNDGHIAIDAIYGLMPPLMKKIVDVLIDLICTATCIYTTYLAVVICANLDSRGLRADERVQRHKAGQQNKGSASPRRRAERRMMGGYIWLG